MENKVFVCDIKEKINNLDPVFCKVVTEDGEIFFVKEVMYSYGTHNYEFHSMNIISEREYRLRKLQSVWQSIKDWDGWDFIKIILLLLLVFCALMSPLFIVDYTMSRNACNLFAQLNGYEHVFNYFSGGCWINHPDLGWINSIQNINIK